jgi:glycosyltransferase involved in cell wall biosynthesis
MYEPLISIIVPVYNVEDYLGECIDSLIGQSYKNLEIICVNDGAQDGSEKIIDQYAQKDRRIKKINQKNTGLNMARATGFKHSTGEYIIFVDSDDAIHNKTIEVAMHNLLESNSEIAVFGYRSFERSIREIKPQVTQGYKVLNGKEQIFRYLLVNDPEYISHTLQLTVWGKLYKRSIVDKIDWVKSNYRQHEDLFWTPYAFNNIKHRICLNKSDFYFYRRDPSRNVLSTATNGNLFNARPVGYLEIVHNFSVLIDELLNANLKEVLKREYEDMMYGMYRGHIEDLIKKNTIDSENNISFIPNYYQYSQQHINNLVASLNAQDHHIKDQNKRIEAIGSKLHDLDAKLSPSHASITYLVAVILKASKYRALRRYRRIFVNK